MVINMNVGGTEKALLNMIAEIPRDKYEITILMLEKYGGFLDSIPSDVHIEYVKKYSQVKDILNKPPKEIVMDRLRNKKLFQALKLSIVYLRTKLMDNRAILFKYLLKDVPAIKTEYDIAVAYAGPMDFISYFVVNKTKAGRKLQWIHFDVTMVGFNQNFAKRFYQQFDKLYVVSEEAKNKVLKNFPALKEKTEVFLNIVSPNEIVKQSKIGNGFSDAYDGLRILTVGRLAPEKGQDLAIETLARLKKEGYKVRWYCIGEGKARKQYEQLIEQYSLQDSFVLLGATSNPYPFIKQCDIYVQPSRYEGYCITLMEAKKLLKPIVTTEVNGVREQINNEKTGLIVDIDVSELYRAIVMLVRNKSLRKKLIANLSNKDIQMKSNSNNGLIESVF